MYGIHEGKRERERVPGNTLERKVAAEMGAKRPGNACASTLSVVVVEGRKGMGSQQVGRKEGGLSLTELCAKA